MKGPALPVEKNNIKTKNLKICTQILKEKVGMNLTLYTGFQGKGWDEPTQVYQNILKMVYQNVQKGKSWDKPRQVALWAKRRVT